jgi:urea ABC transporter urea binding protein
MALSERPLLEVELMAIDEINKSGGILGCQIEPVIMDGASVSETFAQKARELLSSGVPFLFGCWTSASRKAVKLIVEGADGLLWYPLQYEGLEESGHIVYTGSCPIQQIAPAVQWVLGNIGTHIFLVGSDHVFSRTANNLTRSLVKNSMGSIVGERYVPQGGMDFTSTIEEIQRQEPDAVFSTVTGESNLGFYREYHAAGIDAESIPVMAVSLSETELQPIANVAAGHYACQNYFQSLDRPENRRFVANYKKRCGETVVCSAPLATAYTQIYLWKRVVEAAGSFDAAKVRSHVAGCKFIGPTGPIAIQQNHHTSMCAYVGRATPHGQFEVLAGTSPIRPRPWLGIEDSDLKLRYREAIKEAMAAFPNVQNTLVELAAADKRFREAMQATSDGLWDWNVETGEMYFSPAYYRILGYELGELPGLEKTWMDLIHPDERDGVLRSNQDCIENRIPNFAIEYRMRTKSGEWRWILGRGHASARDANKRAFRMIGTHQDITERKRVEEKLRESEQLYRTIADSSPDNIFIVRRDTSIQYMNRKGLEDFGLTPEEIAGKTASDLFLREVAKRVADPISTVFQTGKPVHAENEVSFLGAVSWRDEYWIPLKTGSETTAVLGISRDITERKKIDQMKDEFVSTVSHELRTPLTSIRASLGLLMSGMIGALPEKGQRMLEIAITNTDRLVRLINDILDSEKLASGKASMEKKQCNAAQLVMQAAEVMKPMADKAGISLSVESQNATLWADPDRIAQALTNLVSNAIKFSAKGGRIWVTAERKENKMVFKVQDEGRGIPPDKLGLLFERFQQVDASDAREKGGTGLGLSISKSIVEQHNGRIWVESTVSKGSTFFFTLPLPEDSQVLSQPETMTKAEGAPRVLIIEDDPDLASILAAMLQRHNIQSHLAHNGEKGIALSRQITPDLIVLDMILPDMDGSIVVETLRKDNVLRSIPLVVYTVRELDKQQREDLRLGETLFFTKSRIPPDQFEEKVVQFMKRILENRGKITVS